MVDDPQVNNVDIFGNESEKIFTAICNYFALGQFEVGLALLKTAFKQSPQQVSDLIKNILWFGHPPDWTQSTSVPSSSISQWQLYNTLIDLHGGNEEFRDRWVENRLEFDSALSHLIMSHTQSQLIHKNNYSDWRPESISELRILHAMHEYSAFCASPDVPHSLPKSTMVLPPLSILTSSRIHRLGDDAGLNTQSTPNINKTKEEKNVLELVGEATLTNLLQNDSNSNTQTDKTMLVNQNLSRQQKEFQIKEDGNFHSSLLGSFRNLSNSNPNQNELTPSSSIPIERDTRSQIIRNPFNNIRTNSPNKRSENNNNEHHEYPNNTVLLSNHSSFHSPPRSNTKLPSSNSHNPTNTIPSNSQNSQVPVTSNAQHDVNDFIPEGEFLLQPPKDRSPIAPPPPPPPVSHALLVNLEPSPPLRTPLVEAPAPPDAPRVAPPEPSLQDHITTRPALQRPKLLVSPPAPRTTDSSPRRPPPPPANHQNLNSNQNNSHKESSFIFSPPLAVPALPSPLQLLDRDRNIRLSHRTITSLASAAAACPTSYCCLLSSFSSVPPPRPIRTGSAILILTLHKMYLSAFSNAVSTAILKHVMSPSSPSPLPSSLSLFLNAPYQIKSSTSALPHLSYSEQAVTSFTETVFRLSALLFLSSLPFHFLISSLKVSSHSISLDASRMPRYAEAFYAIVIDDRITTGQEKRDRDATCTHACLHSLFSATKQILGSESIPELSSHMLNSPAPLPALLSTEALIESLISMSESFIIVRMLSALEAVWVKYFASTLNSEPYAWKLMQWEEYKEQKQMKENEVATQDAISRSTSYPIDYTIGGGGEDEHTTTKHDDITFNMAAIEDFDDIDCEANKSSSKTTPKFSYSQKIFWASLAVQSCAERVPLLKSLWDSLPPSKTSLTSSNMLPNTNTQGSGSGAAEQQPISMKTLEVAPPLLHLAFILSWQSNFLNDSNLLKVFKNYRISQQGASKFASPMNLAMTQYIQLLNWRCQVASSCSSLLSYGSGGNSKESASQTANHVLANLTTGGSLASILLPFLTLKPPSVLIRLAANHSANRIDSGADAGDWGRALGDMINIPCLTIRSSSSNVASPRVLGSLAAPRFDGLMVRCAGILVTLRGILARVASTQLHANLLATHPHHHTPIHSHASSPPANPPSVSPALVAYDALSSFLAQTVPNRLFQPILDIPSVSFRVFILSKVLDALIPSTQSYPRPTSNNEGIKKSVSSRPPPSSTTIMQASSLDLASTSLPPADDPALLCGWSAPSHSQTTPPTVDDPWGQPIPFSVSLPLLSMVFSLLLPILPWAEDKGPLPDWLEEPRSESMDASLKVRIIEMTRSVENLIVKMIVVLTTVLTPSIFAQYEQGNFKNKKNISPSGRLVSSQPLQSSPPRNEKESKIINDASNNNKNIDQKSQQSALNNSNSSPSLVSPLDNLGRLLDIQKSSILNRSLQIASECLFQRDNGNVSYKLNGADMLNLFENLKPTSNAKEPLISLGATSRSLSLSWHDLVALVWSALRLPTFQHIRKEIANKVPPSQANEDVHQTSTKRIDGGGNLIHIPSIRLTENALLGFSENKDDNNKEGFVVLSETFTCHPYSMTLNPSILWNVILQPTEDLIKYLYETGHKDLLRVVMSLVYKGQLEALSSVLPVQNNIKIQSSSLEMSSNIEISPDETMLNFVPGPVSNGLSHDGTALKPASSQIILSIKDFVEESTERPKKFSAVANSIRQGKGIGNFIYLLDEKSLLLNGVIEIMNNWLLSVDASFVTEAPMVFLSHAAKEFVKQHDIFHELLNTQYMKAKEGMEASNENNLGKDMFNMQIFESIFESPLCVKILDMMRMAELTVKNLNINHPLLSTGVGGGRASRNNKDLGDTEDGRKVIGHSYSIDSAQRGETNLDKDREVQVAAESFSKETDGVISSICHLARVSQQNLLNQRSNMNIKDEGDEKLTKSSTNKLDSENKRNTSNDHDENDPSTSTTTITTLGNVDETALSALLSLDSVVGRRRGIGAMKRVRSIFSRLLSTHKVKTQKSGEENLKERRLIDICFDYLRHVSSLLTMSSTSESQNFISAVKCISTHPTDAVLLLAEISEQDPSAASRALQVSSLMSVDTLSVLLTRSSTDKTVNSIPASSPAEIDVSKNSNSISTTNNGGNKNKTAILLSNPSASPTTIVNSGLSSILCDMVIALDAQESTTSSGLIGIFACLELSISQEQFARALLLASRDSPLMRYIVSCANWWSALSINGDGHKNDTEYESLKQTIFDSLKSYTTPSIKSLCVIARRFLSLTNALESSSLNEGQVSLMLAILDALAFLVSPSDSPALDLSFNQSPARDAVGCDDSKELNQEVFVLQKDILLTIFKNLPALKSSKTFVLPPSTRLFVSEILQLNNDQETLHDSRGLSLALLSRLNNISFEDVDKQMKSLNETEENIDEKFVQDILNFLLESIFLSYPSEDCMSHLTNSLEIVKSLHAIRPHSNVLSVTLKRLDILYQMVFSHPSEWMQMCRLYGSFDGVSDVKKPVDAWKLHPASPFLLTLPSTLSLHQEKKKRDVVEILIDLLATAGQYDLSIDLEMRLLDFAPLLTVRRHLTHLLVLKDHAPVHQGAVLEALKSLHSLPPEMALDEIRGVASKIKNTQTLWIVSRLLHEKLSNSTGANESEIDAWDKKSRSLWLLMHLPCDRGSCISTREEILLYPEIVLEEFVLNGDFSAVLKSCSSGKVQDSTPIDISLLIGSLHAAIGLTFNPPPEWEKFISDDGKWRLKPEDPLDTINYNLNRTWNQSVRANHHFPVIPQPHYIQEIVQLLPESAASICTDLLVNFSLLISHLAPAPPPEYSVANSCTLNERVLTSALNSPFLAYKKNQRCLKKRQIKTHNFSSDNTKTNDVKIPFANCRLSRQPLGICQSVFSLLCMTLSERFPYVSNVGSSRDFCSFTAASNLLVQIAQQSGIRASLAQTFDSVSASNLIQQLLDRGFTRLAELLALHTAPTINTSSALTEAHVQSLLRIKTAQVVDSRLLNKDDNQLDEVLQPGAKLSAAVAQIGGSKISNDTQYTYEIMQLSLLSFLTPSCERSRCQLKESALRTSISFLMRPESIDSAKKGAICKLDLRNNRMTGYSETRSILKDYSLDELKKKIGDSATLVVCLLRLGRFREAFDVSLLSGNHTAFVRQVMTKMIRSNRHESLRRLCINSVSMNISLPKEIIYGVLLNAGCLDALKAFSSAAGDLSLAGLISLHIAKVSKSDDTSHAALLFSLGAFSRAFNIQQNKSQQKVIVSSGNMGIMKRRQNGLSEDRLAINTSNTPATRFIEEEENLPFAQGSNSRNNILNKSASPKPHDTELKETSLYLDSADKRENKKLFTDAILGFEEVDEDAENEEDEIEEDKQIFNFNDSSAPKNIKLKDENQMNTKNKHISNIGIESDNRILSPPLSSIPSSRPPKIIASTENSEVVSYQSPSKRIESTSTHANSSLAGIQSALSSSSTPFGWWEQLFGSKTSKIPLQIVAQNYTLMEFDLNLNSTNTLISNSNSFTSKCAYPKSHQFLSNPAALVFNPSSQPFNFSPEMYDQCMTILRVELQVLSAFDSIAACRLVRTHSKPTASSISSSREYDAIGQSLLLFMEPAERVRVVAFLLFVSKWTLSEVVASLWTISCEEALLVAIEMLFLPTDQKNINTGFYQERGGSEQMRKVENEVWRLQPSQQISTFNSIFQFIDGLTSASPLYLPVGQNRDVILASAASLWCNSLKQVEKQYQSVQQDMSQQNVMFNNHMYSNNANKNIKNRDFTTNDSTLKQQLFHYQENNANFIYEIVSNISSTALKVSVLIQADLLLSAFEIAEKSGSVEILNQVRSAAVTRTDASLVVAVDTVFHKLKNRHTPKITHPPKI